MAISKPVPKSSASPKSLPLAASPAPAGLLLGLLAAAVLLAGLSLLALFAVGYIQAPPAGSTLLPAASITNALVTAPMTPPRDVIALPSAAPSASAPASSHPAAPSTADSGPSSPPAAPAAVINAPVNQSGATNSSAQAAQSAGTIAPSPASTPALPAPSPTSPSAPATPPTVVSTSPTDAGSEVAVDGSITATFSEEMDPLTLTTSTVRMFRGGSQANGGVPVQGTLAYSGLTLTFVPLSELDHNARYTAMITRGAKDMAGHALANDFEWTFTTASYPPSSGIPSVQAATTAATPSENLSSSTGPVNLSTAADFGILAGGNLTNTPSTIVKGGVGDAGEDNSPAMGSGTPNPHVSTGDAAYTTALAALTSAFADANRACNLTFGAADIGGQNLTTGGTYCFSGDGQVSGTLTLNASEIYVFKVPGTFTVADSSIIRVVNDTNPSWVPTGANIYWRVVGATTLGPSSKFVGTVMSVSSPITVGNGATIYGAILTQSSVTTDGDTITVPTWVAGPGPPP